MTARFLLGFLVVSVAILGGVGCKKKKAVSTAAPVATTPTPAPVSEKNTNFQPGAGAVQNVRQAARRTVSLNDMHQLGIAIQQTFQLDGKMPDIEQIKAEVKTFPNIPAAIQDGTIILTGSKNASGLWAYEVDADKVGGIVLVGGSARRADATEVKQLLAQK